MSDSEAPRGAATTPAVGVTLFDADAEPEPSGRGRALGSTLDHYRLERVLGRGGMGEVFAARDERTDTLVALKTLANTGAALQTRFKREFRALADVEHRNLVRFGELVVSEEGPAFFTMELLDGQPFTRWVRGAAERGRLPDLGRLGAGLEQLLAGVERLHAAGYVHCDLKPSNVLVTGAGRVVVLDFGIIAELGEQRRDDAEQRPVVGTPLYMAPEQAAGAAVGPAADLYAIGVMVYECLTGELPFEGRTLEVLVAKQERPAPDPQERVAGIPPVLRDLCLRLLQREPERRPDIAELRARLRSFVQGGGTSPGHAEPPPFIGRRGELAALEQALTEVRARREPTIVHLRGRSGHGKSTLVRRFIARARADAALVLHGRCRERESVPYKGIDALVDALALHLRGLAPARREALRPRYADALARVFPAFEDVWTWDAPITLDPQDARGLGGAALRELLAALAERETLVLIIDDVQWSDADSVGLLETALREPDAPALLLVLATREAIAEPRLRDWIDASVTRRVELGPLAEDEARELAEALLRRRSPDLLGPDLLAGLSARAEAIALRCGGSPFFIGQMVAGEAGGAALGDSAGELDDIVARRLARLTAGERAALDLVAVAGEPIAQALIQALVAGDGAAAEVEGLCEQGLLVRSAGADPRLEVAHDRIREISLAGLAAQARARIHWQLGQALLELDEPDEVDDRVFTIVEHLDAGLAQVEELDEDTLRTLAGLHRRAGERAASAGAWALADRYFSVGVTLIDPWRAEAAAGRSADPDRRALCLALLFGHAEAGSLSGRIDAVAAFEELLGWSLSQVERGLIGARAVAISAWVNRLEDSLAIGYAELARLGLPLAREPSLLAGLLELLRGWLALGRRELDELLALPTMTDRDVRAQVDVLIAISFVAPYVDPKLILPLSGVTVRLIRRHGYHPGLSRALIHMGTAINALGWARVAAALCDRALAVAAIRPVRASDLFNARVQAQFMIWPASRPLRTLVADIEDRYREACELGRTFEAGYLAVAGGFALFELDTPLHAVADMFDRFERRNPDFGHSVNRPGIVTIRRHIATLVDGAAPLEVDELDTNMPFLRYLGLTVGLGAAVAFADYERATALLDAMPDDYAKVMLGVPQIPRYAAYVAILEARRCVAGGSLRRRGLRRIRRQLRIARRWAGQGPENYGPMAALIEAELACVRGREDRALAAYERARAGALATGALSMLALTCLRRAALALRRGEPAVAERAFAEALDAYEAWGALAVAARLRELGLARAVG